MSWSRGEIEAGLAALAPPGRGIEVELISVVAAATDAEVCAVVVWGPAERFCPGCDQSERPALRACPIMLDSSVGDVQAFDQQHGCGLWWGPPWEVVDPTDHHDLASLLAAVTAAVGEVAERVTDRDDDKAAEVRARLVADLAGAVTALAGGADVEDVVTGSDLYPGVHVDLYQVEHSGEGPVLVAWDYDPRWGAEEDTIVVSEAVVIEGTQS
jgi:hypothetical protein